MLDSALSTSFMAMGNTVRVVVVGGVTDHLDVARARIAELESLWSRFVPSSDVSRLNRAGGRTTSVAPATITLLQYMADAHRRTGGLFDPTQLPHLIEAGYAKSLVSDRLTILPSGVVWSHGLHEMSIDVGSRCVTLPPGVTIDAGGIGKGLAADIVATELVAAGAQGALVSVGGDIRCVGEGDRDGAWEIAIAEPSGTGEIDRVSIRSGAVATSSVLAKTFDHGGERRSHLVDPRSRLAIVPESWRVMQATVVAAECVWAEAMTKAVMLGGPGGGIALVDGLNLAAMIVMDGGTIHRSVAWNEFSS